MNCARQNGLHYSPLTNCSKNNANIAAFHMMYVQSICEELF